MYQVSSIETVVKMGQQIDNPSPTIIIYSNMSSLNCATLLMYFFMGSYFVSNQSTGSRIQICIEYGLRYFNTALSVKASTLCTPICDCSLCVVTIVW